MTVDPEKLKEWMHALFVMEEFGREVSVKKLDTITNRLGKSRTRERGVEWLEIQLQDEVAVGTAAHEAKREKIKSYHIMI